MTKLCQRCQRPKTLDQFQEREDSWGHYAWCDDCRYKTGRLPGHKIPLKQREFIEKTRLFNTRARFELGSQPGTKNVVQRHCREHASPGSSTHA